MGLLGCHLLSCGVGFGQTVGQSDNGSEFIGPWNQRNKQTLYEKIVEALNSESIQISVGRKTYNGSSELAEGSDIESAHHLIEDEFYDMVYCVYFNYKRTIRDKGMKTPMEILNELKPPKIIPEYIGIFPPIITDQHLKIISKSGYHVLRSEK